MKTKLLILFLLLSMPVLVNAQAIDDEIKLIQTAFGMEKRSMVEEYMAYPSSSPFWATYETYEQERRALMKDRILLVNDYLEKFETMTDADADALAARYIKNHASLSGLQGKYFKSFKKVVSPSEALKFLQLESYIQSTILLAISESLPFLGEK
jgi:hypothetical protein